MCLSSFASLLTDFDESLAVLKMHCVFKLKPGISWIVEFSLETSWEHGYISFCMHLLKHMHAMITVTLVTVVWKELKLVGNRRKNFNTSLPEWHRYLTIGMIYGGYNTIKHFCTNFSTIFSASVSPKLKFLMTE